MTLHPHRGRAVMAKTGTASLTIAELREFASFTEAEQLFIERGLDIGLGRGDAFKLWGAWVRRQSLDPSAVPGLSRIARAARERPERRLAGRPAGLHGNAAARHGARPCAGEARQLFGLALSVRAAARRQSAAMSAGGVLWCCGIAAHPPGAAQDATPVAQRSCCDGRRLVGARTLLLS